jgi:hypothetical protein
MRCLKSKRRSHQIYSFPSTILGIVSFLNFHRKLKKESWMYREEVEELETILSQAEAMDPEVRGRRVQ